MMLRVAEPDPIQIGTPARLPMVNRVVNEDMTIGNR